MMQNKNIKKTDDDSRIKQRNIKFCAEVINQIESASRPRKKIWVLRGGVQVK